jgi:hypothetical protein
MAPKTQKTDNFATMRNILAQFDKLENPLDRQYVIAELTNRHLKIAEATAGGTPYGGRALSPVPCTAPARAVVVTGTDTGVGSAVGSAPASTPVDTSAGTDKRPSDAPETAASLVTPPAAS